MSEGHQQPVPISNVPIEVRQQAGSTPQHGGQPQHLQVSPGTSWPRTWQDAAGWQARDPIVAGSLTGGCRGLGLYFDVRGCVALIGWACLVGS
jgi:hypothetical protein